nr:hypothetical protein [Candidatus Sigynarchaeota archaeon]
MIKHESSKSGKCRKKGGGINYLASPKIDHRKEQYFSTANTRSIMNIINKEQRTTMAQDGDKKGKDCEDC